MIEMLQNTPQTATTIDWNTLIIVAVGLGGVFIGFLLGFIWDVIKEDREKKEEFDNVKLNIVMELNQNIARVEYNQRNLRLQRPDTPILYLHDEAWKLALSSGLLRVFSVNILHELAEIYFGIDKINQIIVQRERLPKTTDGIKESDNYLQKAGNILLKEINEIMD
ncbi:MAG: hypothetical protein ACFFCD_16130, partial [Promethearchaeota archaeon]